MRATVLRSLLVLGCLAASPLVSGVSARADAPAHAASVAASSSTRVLPWGDGPESVGLRRAQSDSPGEGVSSIAVGPDGDVWLLDRLHGRVLRLDALNSSIRPVVAAQVPRDAEDLTVGPDGTLGVRSNLRSRVFLYRDGQPAGELEVPRALREVVAFGVGSSHQVTVANAHQETLRLGSPAAPQPLNAVLHSRREGAVMLPGGDGVTVRLDKDRVPELLWNRPGDERNRVVSRRRLGEPALSARVIGASVSTVCLALEHGVPGPASVIRRELRCIDAASGAQVLRRVLDPEPIYLPSRYAAVGGTPLRLAVIEPKQDGLYVTMERVPGATEGVRP